MKYMALMGLFVVACQGGDALVGRDSDAPLCWDYDPCSFDFYSEQYGCTHEQIPDGASCFDDVGIGICVYGLCTHHTECEDGSVDMLQGTCKIGRCVGGRISLVPKIAGVPCVLPIPVGDPPWVEGTCDNDGACAASSP